MKTSPHFDQDPKRQPFEVGELVTITMLGDPNYGKTGIITMRIHYTNPDKMNTAHCDEYSCAVLLTGTTSSEVMVRAKWLSSISKPKKG